MFRTDSRSSPDFSVGAYEHLDPERRRNADPLANFCRALVHIVASILRHLLNAMYETRRREAVGALKRYGHLIGSEPQPHGRTAAMGGCAPQAQSNSCRIDITVGEAADGTTIRCAITGAPCEGDRADLCDEWGCARKAGLSPISHENF